MNILQELFNPIIKIALKGLEVNIDKKALAEFVLHLLGSKEQDSGTAARIDKVIIGGEIIEILDGPTIRAYVEKLRVWADKEMRT